MRSRESLVALLTFEPHRTRGRLSAGLRGHYMEEAHHRRGHATVAAAAGGQPRDEVACGHGYP